MLFASSMARNDADSWAAWPEDAFKLDADSPLAISRSLWDELSQSEADSHSLFASTPATEIREAGVLPSSLTHQESVEAHCPAFKVEQDSPRQKRRRMLLFSGVDADDSALEVFENPEHQMIPGCEDISIADPVSPSSTWYLNPDESFSSMEDTLEQPAESWMVNCFNDSEAQSTSDKMKVQVPLCQTASQISETTQAIQRKHRKGPPTPMSSRCLATGRKHNLVSRPTVASPVAYPFALLKPCGATGDVTLSDINQRLQTPRPKTIRRLNEDPADSDQNLGAGLSGKSVVALTKIHTEGNGSITIMRTKG